MKLCAIQRNAFSSMEEMKSSVSLTVSEGRDDVICPKPRRFRLLSPTINEQPIRSLRRNLGHHIEAELCDSKIGTDLLDILLLKGGCGVEQQPITQMDLTPPSLCGSPPSRVANPLIQDARFGDEKFSSFFPVSPISSMSGQSSSSSPARKGGCVRSNFSNNPAVRVEGFDCLKRGITALA